MRKPARAVLAVALLSVLSVAAQAGVAGTSAATAAALSPATAGVPAQVPTPVLDDGPDSGAGAAAVPTATTSLPLQVGARGVVRTGPAQLLTARLSTRRFTTVGITWAPLPRPDQISVAVRTRSASGTWSPWQGMEVDHEDPSLELTASQARAQGLRPGTQALFAGPSIGIQVMLRGSRQLPEQIRAELIDPGTSPADAAVDQASSGVHAATAGRPRIYSRAAWGADERRVRSAPSYAPTIRAAVIHHTVNANGYSRAAVPGILRADFAYHLSRGWSDIGYNALVDRFGRVWEGRAGGLDRNVIGAHAGGFNAETFGVAALGNYDVARPSAALREGLARVIAWKLDLQHRHPQLRATLRSAGGGTSRYPQGRAVSLPVIMGHRDPGLTACPGRYLYAQLGSIRTRVRVLMQAALTNPSSSPLSVPVGTRTWLSARTLVAQRWQLTATSLCTGREVFSTAGSAGARVSVRADWDGRSSNAPAGPAPAGGYRLALTSRSGTGAARPVERTVLLTPPLAAAEPTGTATSGVGGLVPVTPTRLVPAAPAGVPAGVWSQGRVDVPVLGHAGVPTQSVAAVAVVLHARCAAGAGTLAARPTGSSLPAASSLPVQPGQTRSTFAVLPVGANGSISLVGGGGVLQAEADVVGYLPVTGGGAVQAIETTRILNTATTAGGGRLPAGGERQVVLPTALGGVNLSDVQALLVNVSVSGATAAGGLGVYPPGATAPRTLRFGAGENVDTVAVVPLTGGTLRVRSSAAAHAALDVVGLVRSTPASGAVGALTLLPDAGRRPPLVDRARVSAGSPRQVPVTGTALGVPEEASAVLLRVSGADADVTTSVQVQPAESPVRVGASLRLNRGGQHANSVLVPVDASGAVRLAVGRGSAVLGLSVLGYVR